MTGFWVLVGTLALSAVAGRVHQTRSGRMRIHRAGRRTGRAAGQPSASWDGNANGSASWDGNANGSASWDGNANGSASPSGNAHARKNGHETNETADDLRPLIHRLGATPGERATLLQFSSAFCAPCRATRRILADVSELVPGVAHVEVDAEAQLALVRRLNIRKTPTTLVLDAHGREVKRASGAPRKADVIAAVGSAVAL